MAVVSRRALSSLTVDRPPTPLSPKSELVHRQISSMPPVAVVHGANFDVLKAGDMYPSSPFQSHQMSSPVLPHLSDASSKGAYSPSGVQAKTPLMDVSLSDAHPSERVVVRRAVRRSTSVPTVMMPVAKDDEVRLLSKAEQEMRSREAVKHFRHMAVINNRARTIEEFDLTMAKIRKKKLTNMSTIEGDAKVSAKDAKSQPAKTVDAPPPKEVKDEVKDEEPTPEPEKPKMSLADRMGFGVKTKAQNKWSKLKTAVSVSSSFSNAVAGKTVTGAKTGVSVGSTDLKAVLAAKRAKAAEEMKAFEKMNLPVQEFVQTFRTNVDLVMKASKTTGIPYGDLKALDNPTLISWFHEMDTDNSGTLDFAEFIEGLMKISQTQEFENKMLARRDTV